MKRFPGGFKEAFSLIVVLMVMTIIVMIPIMAWWYEHLVAPLLKVLGVFP